jgi:hypothetical protein
MLSLYIDDLLDEASARALRSHLDACAACGREYEQLALMRETLLRVPESPLPAVFDERLKEAIARLSDDASDASRGGAARSLRGAKTRFRRRFRMWSSVAAVLAIGLLSLFAHDRFNAARFDSTASGSASRDAALSAEAEAAYEGVAEEQIVADANAGQADADANAASDAARGAENTESDRSADVSEESAAPAYLLSDIMARPGSYERYEMPGYPARGTTTSAHRLDEKTVSDELLQEKLAGWTYDILWEKKRDSAFVYRVNLISNEAGMVFNQEIELVISGKVVEVYYATEFMGL